MPAYRRVIVKVSGEAFSGPNDFGIHAPTIEGIVTKAGTNEPVSRASIVVTMVQGELSDVSTVVSDDSGQFVVRNLRPGAHRVFATKDGFVRAEYGQRTLMRPGTPIELAAGETRRSIVISMTATGVISGRALDTEGKPLRGAFVRVSRPAYPSGVRELDMAQRVQTNDLGEFRFFGLEPGAYYLMALPMGSPYIEGDNYIIPTTSPPDLLGGEPEVRLTAAQALSQGIVSPSAFTQDFFQTTYYPGTMDQTAAIPINLQAGAVFSGVELRFQKSPVVHVRGRVMDSSRQPVNATVSLALPFYGTDQRAISARAVDGVFDLRAPAGSYLLTARMNRSTAGSPFSQDAAFMRLDVGDRDIENIALTVFPNYSVTGSMTIDGSLPGGANPDLQRVVINLSAPGAAGVQIRPNAAGVFTISYVARATYRMVLVLLPANTYIKSARLGTQDVIDGILPFETPPRDPLDIVLRPTTAAVSATVVDEAQRPQAGVTVVLVPDAARRSRRDLYRTAVADAGGRVNISGIAPGEYKAFAWENILENSWQDPEILRMYDSRGQAFRLGESSRESMTLRVIR